MKHLRTMAFDSDTGAIRHCGFWGAALPREIVEILEAPRQLSPGRIRLARGARQAPSLPQSCTPAQLNRFRAT